MLKSGTVPPKAGRLAGMALALSKCTVRVTGRFGYCITPIFRVEGIFAIFAKLDVARNFPPAKYSSREIFLPTKIQF